MLSSRTKSPAAPLLCCSFVLLLCLSGCLQPSSTTSAADDGGNDSGSSPDPTPASQPSSDVTATPTPEVTPTSTPLPLPTAGTDCAQLIAGPPVGVACIHCMHPNAQQQALILGQIMRDTCRLSIGTDVLVDGRFGTDFAFLTQLLNFLAENRQVTAYLYLTNGVSQRLGDPFKPGVFGSGLNVDNFRNHIINDAGFRLGYQSIVQQVMNMKQNLSDNVQIVLIPGLEDNLTDSQFGNVIGLTAEVAGDQVFYMRSACPGCADGNGTAIPPGVLEKIEIAAPLFNVRNGLVTNDHAPFLYTFQQSRQGDLTLTDLIATKNLALSLNDAFLLWSAQFQGLPVKDNQVDGRPDPNDRVYQIPSPQEYAEIVNFLR